MAKKVINENYSVNKDSNGNTKLYYKDREIHVFKPRKGKYLEVSYELSLQSDLVVLFKVSDAFGTDYYVVVGTKVYGFDLKPEIKKAEQNNGMLYLEVYDIYPPGYMWRFLFDLEKDEEIKIPEELKFLIEQETQQDTIDLCDTIIKLLS